MFDGMAHAWHWIQYLAYETMTAPDAQVGTCVYVTFNGWVSLARTI